MSRKAMRKRNQDVRVMAVTLRCAACLDELAAAR